MSRCHQCQRDPDEYDFFLRKLAVDRDMQRDCGQDGVCAVSPGCQRHWLERNTELHRDMMRIVLMVRSVLAEDGVREALSQYTQGCALIDAVKGDR